MVKSKLMRNNQKFFIGIDLGGKNKKTTGVCIMKNQKPVLIKDIFGKNLFKVINPYLKETQVIAIDAPLTEGRGKGGLRLYEKFLSTKIFRQEKVSPIPPALMPEFHKFAMAITEKLEEKGFVLGINLIEVFPTLIKKICREDFFFESSPCRTENHPSGRLRAMVSSSNHQKVALICAKIAFLHYQFKTRWLGYKDGFLFLPEMSFWKNEWHQKFYQAWRERERLKYHHLITNIFNK